jgi:hypothetical protein
LFAAVLNTCLFEDQPVLSVCLLAVTSGFVYAGVVRLVAIVPVGAVLCLEAFSGTLEGEKAAWTSGNADAEVVQNLLLVFRVGRGGRAI